MNHQILISSDLEGEFPYAALLERAITAALEAEGVAIPCEVDVLITDDEGIHQINLEQRGVDRPTDVLSFPMFNYRPGQPPADGADADPATGLTPLGDMVISLERARAPAEGPPVSAGISSPARLASTSTASRKGRFSISMTKLMAPPPLPQPKQW